MAQDEMLPSGLSDPEGTAGSDGNNGWTKHLDRDSGAWVAKYTTAGTLCRLSRGPPTRYTRVHVVLGATPDAEDDQQAQQQGGNDDAGNDDAASETTFRQDRSQTTIMDFLLRDDPLTPSATCSIRQSMLRPNKTQNNLYYTDRATSI
ncbi:hypothetical protein GGR53DRAFT_467060 [Hypoxylon sp. FL1150]|nr:hypothetical protein GGR53DRAFT_467060 [Hypoxylon sp. FL1150]